MNTQTINIPKALTLAFALAVGILVLLQVSRSAPAGAAPAAPAVSSVKSANAVRGTVLVTVLLKSNSLTADLPKDATDLLTTTKGSGAARLAAQRNPYRRSESEAVAASIVENARNAAIPMIRRAAAPGIQSSELVQRKIRSLGGSVISASPIPNQIVTQIPRSAIPAIARDPRVARIATARLPVSLAAPIDGSAIWWANGFTGQGSSADGNGSPDAVVFDTGLRTTHEAFNTRLPGDCSSCNGSGPTRVISPVIRSDFSGSKHGNTIGSQIAGTALSVPSQAGMAYGIDKLYDNYQATNPYLWDLGINVGGDTGLGGNADLPEVINYSAGIYQNTVDLDPLANYFDALESRFGILNTVSGGNCGIADPFYTNCGSGPHRISTPGVNYNVLTMGGLDLTADPANIATYAPWPNSSPGPTWGGRKKPDLIGPVFGTAGTPSAINDTGWGGGGMLGTSFAAPVAAAGALLLGSSGVYLPTAQKAIMINSATPVQGQTYWTPRTGWGAINMTNAYYARGNYVNANVSGTGPNSARFFQVTGVASGDRATLVWNRRTNIDDLPSPDNGQITNPGYYNLTNLDLTQFDPGTLAATSTGGSDAGDTVDTDQTVTAANPMPGNGSDGGDNIEQIRSTATGTQILKVKALSSVDGAASEPFSLAASGPVTPLSTPIPEVTLTTTPSLTGLAENFTVSATVQNPSDDLALESTDVDLSLPAGTTLESGADPQALGTIAPSSSAVATWTVQSTTAGAKTFTAIATGTSNDEDFSGEGEATINVDSTPPTVTVAPPATYSAIGSPTFNWTASDSQSPVAGYDVDAAIDQGGWVSQLTNSSQTSLTLTGGEGQLVRIRVRATDDLGNTSAWTEVSTTIDAIPPVVTFGTPDTSVRGSIRVPVFLTNSGSPVTGRFTFADTAGGRTGVVANGQYVTYKNITSKQIIANLRATATDALGRSASFSQDYPVQTRLAPNGMRVLSLSRVGRYVKITGKTQKTYNGKVTFSAKRIGKKGTKKASKRVTVKKGRFTIKLRVANGRYKFVVTAGATKTYAEASISKILTVK
jgi:hypothetical protein